MAIERYDHAKIEFRPKEGYYIKSIKIATSNIDSPPVGNNEIDISTLPTNHYLGARDYEIPKVEFHTWIDVEYAEKPTLPTYWLGTDF